MAADILDEAVDRAEAAGHLESIDEVGLAGDRDVHAIRTKVGLSGVERQARGAMAREVGEARGLETTGEDERDGGHAPIIVLGTHRLNRANPDPWARPSADACGPCVGCRLV